MRSPMKPQYGFTLLEILVAISIFAVVSAVSFGTLINVIDQDERLEQERAYWQGLTSALLRMEDDLVHATARKVRDINGLPIEAFLGRPVDPRAVSPPSLEFSRSGQWTLQTSSRPATERVAYRLSDGTLTRELWPALDRSPVDQPLIKTLLSDVEQFDLRFYNATDGWSATWPADQKSDALPRGVELRIKIRNREPVHRLFIVNG